MSGTKMVPDKGKMMKIPWRLADWSKVKKTGRGYTRRELTVVKLLQDLSASSRPRSFLNIGFHDHQDIRNRWWIDICQANNIDYHILEVFEPNVQNFLDHAAPEDHHRITCGNLLDIESLYSQPFDVILHWHGPEHLEQQTYLDALPALSSMANKLLILGCPNGEEEQNQAYGNPYEEHISFWTEQQFQELGFETILVSDKSPGHITAYKIW